MFLDLSSAFLRVGLRLQLGKCSFATSDHCPAGSRGSITVLNEEVKCQASGLVKVLGLLISLDGSDEEDCRFRLGRSWRSFWSS
eukprot:13634721-Alexandrium_andersonii.AAC.1